MRRHSREQQSVRNRELEQQFGSREAFRESSAPSNELKIGLGAMKIEKIDFKSHSLSTKPSTRRTSEARNGKKWQ